MIAFLRGRANYKRINYVVLEVNDIGYQVFLTSSFLEEIKEGQEYEIHIHQQLKDDLNDLYGFKSIADLELFQLLISVSGVGPKSGLGILNLAGSADVKEAILSGDASSLTKVSGIGKKTAERLVLELKTKILKLSDTKDLLNSNINLGADEIDALLSLGYSLVEARTALKSIDQEIKDSGARVKEALRQMRLKS